MFRKNRIQLVWDNPLFLGRMLAAFIEPLISAQALAPHIQLWSFKASFVLA